MNNIFDIKFLLILYLIQLSNLSSNTLGKQLKEYVYANRLIQHIINLTFLFVLISLADKDMSIQNISINSFSVYFIYLLSTKLDLQYNILILLLILFYYFYKRNNESINKRINEDSDLDKKTKEILTVLGNNKNNIFGFGIVVSLIYFTYVYCQRKTNQYGGSFSYSNFFLF